MIVGAAVGIELVELVLREISDVEPIGARHPARHHRQPV